MKIIDEFPMKPRTESSSTATKIGRGRTRLRRTADGREWRIDAVESTISNGSVALCMWETRPSVGDDVMICGR